MTTYELLIFGHLLFAIAWVGTDIGLQVLASRILAAGGRRRVELLEDTGWLSTRLLMPCSLLVVLFGVLLVLDQDAYGFDQAWISFGLAGYLFSAILGASFLGPESKRVGALASEVGAEDPEVERRIRRVIMLSRIELVVLVLIVLDMVLKPGL